MQTVLGFSDFQDQERVVAIVRHHWWLFIRELLLFALFFLAPFFLIPLVFGFAAATGSAPEVSGGVVLFFASFWTLILWNLLFSRWTDFYFDLWIITNRRIINIDQRGFFRRDVSTLFSLDRIEDIETQTEGIIGNLLNFGHVQVQTSAHEEAFNMTDVANPVEVERIIRSAQQERSTLSPRTNNDVS